MNETIRDGDLILPLPREPQRAQRGFLGFGRRNRQNDTINPYITHLDREPYFDPEATLRPEDLDETIHETWSNDSLRIEAPKKESKYLKLKKLFKRPITSKKRKAHLLDGKNGKN